MHHQQIVTVLIIWRKKWFLFLQHLKWNTRSLLWNLKRRVFQFPRDNTVPLQPSCWHEDLDSRQPSLSVVEVRALSDGSRRMFGMLARPCLPPSSDAEHSRLEEPAMPTARPGSPECWLSRIGLSVVHSRDPVKIAETPLTGGWCCCNSCFRHGHLNPKLSDTPDYHPLNSSEGGKTIRHPPKPQMSGALNSQQSPQKEMC